MSELSSRNLQARAILERQFSPSFPRGFRALQDMALAGSSAYKNHGKRAWLGFGRDLTIESMRKYEDSVRMMVMSLDADGFINLPTAAGKSEEEQINKIVELFFIAYPNWPDAEAAWDVIGRGVMNAALRHCGY